MGSKSAWSISPKHTFHMCGIFKSFDDLQDRVINELASLISYRPKNGNPDYDHFYTAVTELERCLNYLQVKEFLGYEDWLDYTLLYDVYAEPLYGGPCDGIVLLLRSQRASVEISQGTSQWGEITIKVAGKRQTISASQFYLEFIERVMGMFGATDFAEYQNMTGYAYGNLFEITLPF